MKTGSSIFRIAVAAALSSFALITHADQSAQPRLEYFDSCLSECSNRFDSVVKNISSLRYTRGPFKFNTIPDRIDDLKDSARDILSELLTSLANLEEMNVPEGQRVAKANLLEKYLAMRDTLTWVVNLDAEEAVAEISKKIMDFTELPKPPETSDDDDGTGSSSWSPLAVSLVPSLEFPGKDADVFGLRLNLLVGRHRDVCFADVGTVCNLASDSMRGVQLAGIANAVAGSAGGMQVAGMINMARCSYGVQVAGIANIDLDARGIFVAGLSNVAGNAAGVQCAAFGNMTLTSMKGVQLSAWANVNMGYADCLQVSGLGNESGWFSGMQVSAYLNKAYSLDGVQIGAMNITGEMHGVQIGIANYAKSGSGFQLGVINIIRESSLPVLPILNMRF